MSNWEIVRQDAVIDKEPVSVECKEITWRPASEKEMAGGSGQFKRLGTPTFRVLFKHVADDLPFKVVAQLVKKKRSGKVVGGVEWRVNLHHPDEVKTKQLMTRQRTTSVSIDCPGETVVYKSSTGTSPFESFFDRVFPENVRDTQIRERVCGLLNEAISEREAA